MSDPAQIPASVIPELVEYLMKQEAPKSSVSSAYVSLYKSELSYSEVRGVLTAALEAFNDRDSGCSAKELAEDIKSLPGGPLWPGGVEGDQDETGH